MTISGTPIGPPGGTNRIENSKGVEEPGQSISSPKHEASRVEVSDSARQMSELSKLVREAPEMRTDLVNDIKARVESGTYSVNLDRLAEKLSEVL